MCGLPVGTSNKMAEAKHLFKTTAVVLKTHISVFLENDYQFGGESAFADKDPHILIALFQFRTIRQSCKSYHSFPST